MVNTKELKIYMLRKGINQKQLAQILDISEKTLTSRFKKKIFNSFEMQKMIDVLDIKNPSEIFFDNKVT